MGYLAEKFRCPDCGWTPSSENLQFILDTFNNEATTFKTFACPDCGAHLEMHLSISVETEKSKEKTEGIPYKEAWRRGMVTWYRYHQSKSSVLWHGPASIFNRWVRYVCKKKYYLSREEIKSMLDRFYKKHEGESFGRWDNRWREHYWNSKTNRAEEIYRNDLNKKQEALLDSTIKLIKEAENQ